MAALFVVVIWGHGICPDTVGLWFLTNAPKYLIISFDSCREPEPPAYVLSGLGIDADQKKPTSEPCAARRWNPFAFVAVAPGSANAY